MPVVQGTSKKQANYRPGERPEIRCGDCKYMWPKAAIGGCRYVRGIIRPDDVCDLFAPAKRPGS
jgi:hypothetical protein